MTVSRLCRAVSMSRQNYYKARRKRQRKRVEETAIEELVDVQRRIHPHMGCRKLLVVLKPQLQEMGIEIGRDRFFELMRRKDKLVKRRKRRGGGTCSRHRYESFPNLYREMHVDGIHQAWLSDLTYIDTDEGFLYWSLLSDAYSRKVLGSTVSESLEAEGCIKTVLQAIARWQTESTPVHHSDRGIQYCCHDYVNLLTDHGIAISMTEENHCYENAQAERLIGILKQEYELGGRFKTKEQARRAIAQAVELYNRHRPHTSLSYMTPHEVHSEAA